MCTHSCANRPQVQPAAELQGKRAITRPADKAFLCAQSCLNNKSKQRALWPHITAKNFSAGWESQAWPDSMCSNCCVRHTPLIVNCSHYNNSTMQYWQLTGQLCSKLHRLFWWKWLRPKQHSLQPALIDRTKSAPTCCGRLHPPYLNQVPLVTYWPEHSNIIDSCSKKFQAWHAAAHASCQLGHQWWQQGRGSVEQLHVTSSACYNAGQAIEQSFNKGFRSAECDSALGSKVHTAHCFINQRTAATSMP
jgi:hypothetical protein